jgi:hypothetical protein
VKRLLLAATVLALTACGGEPERATTTTMAATSTTVALGQDPTKPTTAAASPASRVAGSLRANGFEVTGLKRGESEGGSLFGMRESWDVRIEGVGSLINVFGDAESLTAWLETAESFNGIVVFSAADVWAVSLESDGPARAKSKRLATEIGRKLYEDWQGSIRTIGV